MKVFFKIEKEIFLQSKILSNGSFLKVFEVLIWHLRISCKIILQQIREFSMEVLEKSEKAIFLKPIGFFQTKEIRKYLKQYSLIFGVFERGFN